MSIFGPHTIELASGIGFDLENPDPATISVYDLSASLSNLCRYTGHCSCFYSVAQHSVLCAAYAEERWGLRVGALALLHDGHEFATGDVNTPFKRLIYKSCGAVIEQIAGKIQAAIWEAAGMDRPTGEEWRFVKTADLALLATEATRLMPSRGEGWNIGVEADPDTTLRFLSPLSAEEAFIDACERYGIQFQYDRDKRRDRIVAGSARPTGMGSAGEAPGKV